MSRRPPPGLSGALAARLRARSQLSRRGLLGAAAATAGGLLVPRGLLAAGAPDRRFLFVFANGGWDVTYAFAPMFDSANVDTEADGESAEIDGVTFVDQGDRPSVRAFFERHASRTCVINGLEVRSITHERCRRLIMTGGVDSADDWGALLAANGPEHLLPCLVVSGPSFTDAFGASVVRVGENGQLSDLLDRSVFNDSELWTPGTSAGGEALEDAFLASRIADLQSRAGAGAEVRLMDGYAAALAQSEEVKALGGELDLSVISGGYVEVSQRAGPIWGSFERGLSRCAVLQHDGLWDVGWDSHSGIQEQSDHFETLFQDLNAMLDELDSRVGPDGAPLSESVTVVVLSEMGRHPRLNANGGKDHWTFTSAMVIGPGVAGGQVIGGFDGDLIGRSVDLASGEIDDGGTALTAAHLGATLLAMGDVDPEAWLPGVAPITAAID